MSSSAAPPPTNPVRYGTTNDAWKGYDAYLLSLLTDVCPKRVCELGAGAKPFFDLDVATRRDFHYTLLDISSEELAKAPPGYERLVCDIAAPNLSIAGDYDFVFSRMLCEHIPDGAQFHKNVFSMLRPGGIAVHFMPTLFSLPFLINRLVPERFSDVFLDVLSPKYRERRGKFPAYYSWCRGPTRATLEAFRKIGYQILMYKGFFGHGYYMRFGPLFSIHWAMSKFLVKHPVPMLTSYAWLTLQKPREGV